jgi:hypothetical protein
LAVEQRIYLKNLRAQASRRSRGGGAQKKLRRLTALDRYRSTLIPGMVIVFSQATDHTLGAFIF